MKHYLYLSLSIYIVFDMQQVGRTAREFIKDNVNDGHRRQRKQHEPVRGCGYRLSSLWVLDKSTVSTDTASFHPAYLFFTRVVARQRACINSRDVLWHELKTTDIL